MSSAQEEAKRCGFIAVIGAPNAGKSTLVNALVGAKVSIVTQKVQTTRARVRGVAIAGATQLVFIDTPGIFKPRRRLDRAMVAAAWESLDGADAVLLVVDAPSYLAGSGAERSDAAARHASADTDAIIEALKERRMKAVLVINKIDKIARVKLLGLVKDLTERVAFEETFLVAAETGDGVEDLKAYITGRMPESPWMFPEDQLSDLSERLLAAEITREKIYLRLHQELPYESMVETESWKESKTGIRIEQTIYVARDSQKGIVLGKGGQTLKVIGAAAREELSTLLERPVHLFLHVKVRENWAEEAERYRAMGLNIVD